MPYFSHTVRTAEMDDPERFFSEAYGRMRWDFERSHFTQQASGDERFQVASAVFDGSFDCDSAFSDLLVLRGAGSSAWEEGRDAGDLKDAPGLLRPHKRVHFTSDDRLHAIVLNSDALTRTARLLYAQDDFTVYFDSPHPIDPTAAATSLAVIDMAIGDREEGLLANDLVRSTLYRLLAVTTLECFRLDGDREELSQSAEQRHRTYRLGADFLHDFASLPITIDDAAEAAGVSIPELVKAFHAHSADEAGPTAYLRRIRLDAARRDLDNADPAGGDTVAQIARRWGFRSITRFTRDFRAAFGQPPEALLHR